MITNLSEKQKEVVNLFLSEEGENYDGQLDYGSIRSGKSVAGLIAFMLHSALYPDGTTHLISGKTTGSIRHNVIKPLKHIIGSSNMNYNHQKQELYVDGQIYRCIGASKIDAQDVIQGDTIGDWYGDEIVNQHPEFISEAINRMSLPDSKFFWNCNPESPYHPIKTEYIDRAEEKRIKVRHWTLDDNPYIASSVKDKYRRQLTGVFYKRSILGLWTIAEGLIYPDFEDQINWIEPDEVPKLDYSVVGIDYGITNPQVYLFVGFRKNHYQEMNIYIIDEYYDHAVDSYYAKTDSEYFNDLLGFHRIEKPRKYIIDPSAASFRVEMIKGGLQNVQNARNEVLEGIRNVQKHLANGNVYVVKRACPNLAKEFSTYMWDERKQERGIDEPLKENDHTMDALRYAINTMLPSTGVAESRGSKYLNTARLVA